VSAYVEAIVRDPERLAALYDLALLDSAVEPAFDRLTRLATKLLQVPTALFSLVDEDRQFFKSCIGLPDPWSSERQTPLSHSFCQYAVASNEPFIIEDARIHPLVATNLAIRDLDVVAYAGIPLVTSRGFAIGTFCVIDKEPRRWSSDDLETLRDLASMVITEIELRSEIIERQRMAREREELLLREQVARAEVERGHQRISLLAEASKLLVSTLDYEDTLPKLATLLRCSFADRCEIYLLKQPDQLDVIVAEHDQLEAALLPASVCTNPFDPQWMHHPLVQVLRSQQSIFHADESDAVVGHIIETPAPNHVFSGQSPSLIAAPIAVDASIYGLLVLATNHQCWSDADLALVEEIARRTAMSIANTQLYRESVQAVRARDDVLAVVTHDLRSSMHLMQLYATVLQQCVERASIAEPLIGESVAQIGLAGEKMSSLLNELTDAATIQGGQRIELQFGPVDIGTLVREVVYQQQQLLKRHWIRIDVAAHQLVVTGDRDRLERVLTNLLSNAIKYSMDGGEIMVAVAREEHDGTIWATIRVQDQGIGIPAVDFARIFEPFYRGSNVPKNRRGMGIGLASIQQIVKQHSGKILVESTEGQGTIFTVRLPVPPRHAD
jgi:signal transduction histidine kinase